MKYIVALDVGGTKIAGALISQGRILKKIKTPTKAHQGKMHILRRICNVISALISEIDKKDVRGIGIGLPGPVNIESGTLLSAPNLPGCHNVPVKKIIEKMFRVRARIENDAKCAALGESRFFKCKDLICLTLGTGIGGGIIINREIYHGNGVAGEIGHMTIEVNGPKCSCGNQGCFEEYVSVRGIRRIAQKHNSSLGPRELSEKAYHGDKKAKAIYNEVGKYLGVGLTNLVNIFNPQIIVVNGGISKAGKFLMEPAIKEMKKRRFRLIEQNTKIKLSELQEDAGLLGASMLFEK